MRTLLIDNYDSYTYNLFQLIAGVLGTEPVVITNDEIDAGQLDLSGFDNVVISPGPGRPGRDRDFGVSAAAIADSDVPLLGVCLGHQGIAAVEGGGVEQAPRARHGHLADIRHDGTELFRGLPSPFTGVRYHSLRVSDPLPENLEATAWADDGVVMGIRHRDRPLWGVQFHPESVATEYGAELIANFRDLTEAHAATAATAPPEPREAPEPRAEPPAADSYRLHHTVLDHAVDTEAAFTRLYADSPRAFWLDSSHVESGLSRFSYLGDDSGPLAEAVSYRVADGTVRVRGEHGVREVDGSVFDYLSGQLRERSISTPELPFDFTCGYAGYFGYELKADLGAEHRYRSDAPDASWLFVDRMLAVDHEEGRTYLLALSCATRPDTETAARKWLGDTETVLRELADREPPGLDPAVDATEALLDRGKDQYLEDIETCQSELHAGESYEICLTNMARTPVAGDGYSFYRALRQGNPAPYGAFLRFDGVDVACSSPERFLKIDQDGWAETKPIKGTTPRGETADEDRRLRDSLAASDKTRAENLMIVDLLRNDLGRVCDVGSVHVPRLMAAETYATVHQLVSTIRGHLRPGVGPVECVRACFPGGSMTGAPKRRTMEIIDSLESGPRGVYSGAIGFLGCNGSADLNIVIRTAVRVDGEWRVGAGGAIVLDSDPTDEYEEMLLKARATLQAPRRAEQREEGSA